MTPHAGAAPIRLTLTGLILRVRGRWRHRSTTAPDAALVWFSLSSLALNAATLVAGTLALRWIDPPLAGIWQTLVLAQMYFRVVRLGVVNGLNRELPYLFGRADRQRAFELARTAQVHALACAAAAAAGGAAALWAWWDRGPDWRAALASMAVVASTGFYFEYLAATFRSGDDFRRLASVQAAQAAAMLLLPLAAAQWQFRGFCLHAAVQAVVAVACAHRLRPLHVAVRWHGTAAALLLRTGLPLFASGYVHILTAGLDRLVLLRVAGTEALGYYAPALAVAGAVSVAPNALATYLYPRLSFELGRGRSSDRLWRTTLSATLTMTLCTVPVIILIWVMAPGLVSAFLPAYERSVPAIRAAAIAGAAASAAACTTMLGALKAWTLIYAYAGIAFALKLVLSWYGAAADDPVTGVAIGSMSAALLAGIAGVALACRAAHAAAADTHPARNMTLRCRAAYGLRTRGLWLIARWYTLLACVRLAFHQARVGPGFSARGPIRLHVDPSARLSFGRDCRINSGFAHNAVGGSLRTGLWVGPNAGLSCGDRVGISNSTIVCMERITIEDDVFIGGDCRIYDTDFHPLQAEARLAPGPKSPATAPIRIRARAFIGGHSLILKGTTIGEEAVIGAGSVVTRDVPCGEVWAGNPARFIRKL